MPKKTDKFETIIQKFIKEMDENNICFMGCAYDKETNKRAMFNNFAYKKDTYLIVNKFIKSLYDRDETNKHLAIAIMVGALKTMVEVGYVELGELKTRLDPQMFN